MIHRSIVVSMFSLLAALQRPTVSAFASLIPRRSTLTRCGTLMQQPKGIFTSNNDELISKEFIEDKKTRMFVDNLIKEKQLLFERLNTEKDLFEQMLKEKEAEKDKIVKEKKEKEESFKLLIASIDRSIQVNRILLQNKPPKLTVRGLFEFFGWILKDEIVKNTKASSIQEFPNITQQTMMSQTWRDAATLAYNKNSSASKEPSIMLLREYYEMFADVSLHNGDKCTEFYTNLYGELQNQIHGTLWPKLEAENTLKGAPGGAMYSSVLRQLFKKKFHVKLVD